MSKNGRLKASEKERVVTGISEGLSLVDLAKELGRDCCVLS